MKKIAFIGSGTMGTALVTAACKGIDPKEVVVTDFVQEKAKALADQLGCHFVEGNKATVQSTTATRRSSWKNSNISSGNPAASTVCLRPSLLPGRFLPLRPRPSSPCLPILWRTAAFTTDCCGPRREGMPWKEFSARFSCCFPAISTWKA